MHAWIRRCRRGLAWGLAFCVALATLAALSPAAAAETEGTRKNRALLIGVDDFVSFPSTYPSSTNNVFAMQEALQQSSEPFETIMIPDTPITCATELAALIQATFGNATESDVSYLYISTHGEYDPDNGVEASLLFSDGAAEAYITPAQLQAALDPIAGTKVVLLDACYSGAFIGKGMRTQPETLYFQNPSYKVLASSGAREESWYWSANPTGDGAATLVQGAFYFTQMLSQSLNPRYGAQADANRDGDVTLSELYHSLTQNHAASTPQVYPQEDNFVVFSYDLAGMATLDISERSPITDITFSSSAMSREDNHLTLEYTALRPVRVAYQVVYRQDGEWLFNQAQLLYDDVEQYTAYGDEEGAVSPGRKVRTLSLQLPNGDASGYVLVQIVSLEDGKLTVHAGSVIAIIPSEGDLALSVDTAATFIPNGNTELAICVSHAFPCRLSVSILNDVGATVRRLCYRQSTRPLKLLPRGSTFYWNGLDNSGNPAPAGVYTIRVTGYLGQQETTVNSAPVTLTLP